MLFSQRLPLSSLISLCRVLRHSLGAGITLRDVFRQQAERARAPLGPVAQRIRRVLDRGESLQMALQGEKEVFPPLFLSMAGVGEETGHLVEVFTELEKYYTLQMKLQRQFRSQSFLPLVQLGVAFFVIAILIFALGAIASSRGGTGPAILGFTGLAGSVAFLVLSFGMIALLYAGYLFLRTRVPLDALLLRLPGVGPCLEALVLGRFCLALHLTLESTLSIGRALELSLQATGNAGFRSATRRIAKALQRGNDLTLALTESRLFSDEFLNLIAVAEEGGRLPEVLRHQAAYFHEEAERRLKLLTRMVTLSVWFIYAGFMIVAIFYVAGMYLRALGG